MEGKPDKNKKTPYIVKLIRVLYQHLHPYFETIISSNNFQSCRTIENRSLNKDDH